MVFKDFDSFIISPLSHGFSSAAGPCAPHPSVNQFGFRLLSGHEISRMPLSQEIFPGSDIFDNINSQCLIVYGNALHYTFNHGSNLIVDKELSEAECHSKLKHAHAVNQVGSGQGRQQCGDGLFMTGLSIRKLGVTLGTCHIAGKSVEVGQFGNSGVNHPQFRCTHGCSNICQVKGCC